MKTLKEAVHKFTNGEWNIRVWREYEDLQKHKIVDILKILSSTETHTYSPEELAEVILKLPKMNAVEVVNTNHGYGVVWYKDWP